jgi:RHS repeat-associated protein
MSKRVLCVVVVVILGQALSGAAGDPGTVRWSARISGNVPNGIAIGDDGTAYATSQYYGYIGAVDPSGTRIWQLRLNNSYWESVSAPSIAADGTLYVRTNEVDGLWAINPDGTVKWNIPFTSGHSPSIGADGTLYLSWGTGSDQELRALRPDGTTKWSFPTDGILRSAPSIGASGDLYLSCDVGWPSASDSVVIAITPDGEEVWSVPIPGRASAPSIGADGTLYVGSSNGFVQAIEGDGDLGWQYTAGGSISTGVAIADDGGLFFGASDGKLYALNADGSDRWSYQAGGSPVGTPALGDDGSVFFSSQDKYVHAVDAGGSFLWKRYVTYWRLTGTLIGKNGDVYVVGENGYYHPHIYAINSDTGAVAQAPWPVGRQNARGTSRRRPIDMPPVELELGVPYASPLPAGEYHHFTVDIDRDRNLLIEVQPGEGVDGVVVDAAIDKVEHPGAGDYSTMVATQSGSYELLVSPTREGTYMITVLGTRVSGNGGTYSITARYADSHLSDIMPRGGGNLGEISVRVTGLGFTQGVGVELGGTGLSTLSADAVEILSSTELTCRFDLTGLSPAEYYVTVTWPGGVRHSLQEAFTVSPGTGPSFDAQLAVPEAVRPGRHYTYWLEYSNDGDTNMRAPLLFITSPQKVEMRLAKHKPFTTEGLQVLGISSSHPAGVLRPGERYRVPIYFVANNSSKIEFNVERLESYTTAIDWDEVGDEIRPTDMSDDLWTAVFNNIKTAIGSTWGSYEQTLADLATYLSRYGTSTYDVSELFGTLFQRATGSYLGEVHAAGFDAYSAARGVPLFFARVARGDLKQRFSPGPLGRGWSHGFEFKLTKPATKQVEINGPGGSKRSFFVDRDGSWRGGSGDYGRLEEGWGGSFVLTEKSGLSMTFNSAGLLIGVDEQNGNGLTLFYEGEQLDTIFHTNGQSISLDYNADGRIEYLTDHAGRITEYVYDPSGELLEQVIAPGGVTTEYDYRPPTGGAGDFALISETHPDGTHTYFDHDSKGRMSSWWLDDGEVKTDYGYDRFGSVFKTDALNHEMSARFGSFGELLEIENHLYEKLRFKYDGSGNLKRMTLPDESAFKLVYDSRGNPVEFTAPSGAVTRAGFTDNPTRLDWFSDARDNPMDFVHENGNPTSVVFPDGTTEDLTYDDDDSDLETFTNRREETISLVHNDLGELTDLDWPDGTWFDFTHDEVERTWTFADAAGTTTIDFDARGILDTVTGPGVHGIEYTFNDAGRRTRLETDDGFVLKYFYDTAGRLEYLKDGADFEIVRYHYDDAGRLRREDRGNGTYTVYGYDAADRVRSVTHYAPNDSVQSFFNYTYDENGNPETMTTVAGNSEYDYDDDGQLIGVSYPSGREVTYEYDAAGNRVVVTDDGAATVYETNDLNQYTTAGATSFNHDADGNLGTLTDSTGATTFVWDPENRLQSIETPANGTWTFSYDAMGSRIGVDHDGAVRQFVVDPVRLGSVITEYDGDGELVARYIHGLGLAARLDPAGDLAYYGFDAIGNTRQLTDQSGSVVNSYDYGPFGALLDLAEGVPNVFRYGGRFGVMDDGHGMLDMRARLYDPVTGRFLSPDPVGLAAGPNLYTYVGNSPVRYRDPSGLVHDLAFALDDALDKFSRIGSTGDWEKEINDYAIAKQNVGRQATNAAVKEAFWYIVTLGLMPCKSACRPLYYANDGYQLYRAGSDAWKTRNLGPPRGGARVYILYIGGTFVIFPVDPNEKSGPPGIGPDRIVVAGKELPYTVYFENLATATASAQEVFVADCLDRNLDWTTFRVREVEFGDVVVSNSDQNAVLSKRVGIPDFREEVDKEWWVDVETEINLATGCFKATLRQLDPETGDLPEDPFAGFLPPEDGSGRGQGHVSYSVSSKDDLEDDRLIRNKASIVFDTNEPIWTNEVTNTTGPIQLSLEVSLSGDGTGTVTSDPVGIDCGATCQAYFAQSTEVELVATPDHGSLFGGWSGDADCVDGIVAGEGNVSCIATFTDNSAVFSDDFELGDTNAWSTTVAPD